MKKKRVPKLKTPVALFDARTLSIKLNKKQLGKKLPDGTKIREYEIVQVKDKIYLDRRGLDRAGNCHLTRNELVFTPEGSLILARIKNGGYGVNTCTGAPCSSCKIDESKGFTVCVC